MSHQVHLVPDEDYLVPRCFKRHEGMKIHDNLPRQLSHLILTPGLVIERRMRDMSRPHTTIVDQEPHVMLCCGLIYMLDKQDLCHISKWVWLGCMLEFSWVSS